MPLVGDGISDRSAHIRQEIPLRQWPVNTQGMFESFTHPGRRVLMLAQEEARALNHPYIGTEHILLGVIHGGDSIAAKTLESLGVLLAPARDQVVKLVGQGKDRAGELPFTPRAKKVLDLSNREAKDLGDSYVGPEHLLLGIVREGDSMAAQVLTQLGVDLSRLQNQVMMLARTSSDAQDLPASAQPDSSTRETIMQRLDAIQSSLSRIADTLAEILRRMDGPA